MQLEVVRGITQMDYFYHYWRTSENTLVHSPVSRARARNRYTSATSTSGFFPSVAENRALGRCQFVQLIGRYDPARSNVVERCGNMHKECCRIAARHDK